VKINTFSVAAAALLLSACATQTYEPKPLQSEQAAESFRARSLADAGMGQMTAWGLPELTQAAMRLHPDLDVARAQWRAAQAGEITAGQKPNPTVSPGGEHHSRHQNVSPWTYSLGIDIPVETHGKREARMEQAAALSEAARLEIARVAWQVRSNLRARLMDVYLVQQQTAHLQQEIDARAQIVALLESRLAAGLVGGTDLSDARLQLQKTRAALITESARLAEARAGLAAAVGLPEHALDNVTLSFSLFERDNIELPADEVQRAALLNRLEIRKALASYDAAEARLKLEIARQYPDFSFAPGYSWDQGDVKWSLGLSLVLALLNKNEGPIAEARAQRDLQAAQFNALQADIIGQQAQNLARWQAAQAEISKARQLVAAQQARLAQTQRQFDAGYADRLELISAQLELITAENGVLAAQLKAQRAFGQLEDATQQPLDGSAPMPEIPQNTDQ
jgi:outer membrane protein TolC